LLLSIEVHLFSTRSWDHRHFRTKRANPLDALHFILCYNSVLSNEGTNSTMFGAEVCYCGTLSLKKRVDKSFWT